MANAKFSFRTVELEASLSMGFRPLYLLAVLWAILSVSLWVYAPAYLSPSLFVMYWHAHEMLWGFVGTIAVGFLLTASATWTGINPLFGRPLALLCLLWVSSRALFLWGTPATLPIAGALDSLFFLIAAVAIARSVVLSKNWRNLMMPLLLCFLAATQFVFVLSAAQFNTALMWQSFNIAWVVMAVISLLISSRVIPFFTQRRLANPSIPLLASLQPVILALGVMTIAALMAALNAVAGALLVVAGIIVFYQIARWHQREIWQESLLWILFVGYACIGAGLLVAGAYFAQSTLGLQVRLAVPIHVVGVAGFATLIIGMLVRTSQGHLGLALSTTPSLRMAFYGMLLCAVFRLIALWPSAFAIQALHLSTLFWVLSLGLYINFFVFRLLSPRPTVSQ